MTFSRQEAFNKAYLHLLKQGKPARSFDFQTCRYRTEDGLSCAVGALIPDNKYQPSFENKHAGTDLILTAVGAPRKDAEFLRLLQKHLHDSLPRDPDEFIAKLKALAPRFAVGHGLSLPETS